MELARARLGRPVEGGFVIAKDMTDLPSIHLRSHSLMLINGLLRNCNGDSWYLIGGRSGAIPIVTSMI